MSQDPVSIAELNPCPHRWRIVSDWYGYSDIAVADCSYIRCEICGEYQDPPREFNMSKDPVSVDELRHDIDSAKRLEEQDRLEAEFRRDPDWDLVAEHLIKRETVGDVCSLIYDFGKLLDARAAENSVYRAARIIRLAIEQCAREHAEKEAQ